MRAYHGKVLPYCANKLPILARRRQPILHYCHLGGGKGIGVNPQQLRLQTLAEYQLNLGVYKRHIAAQIPHLFRDNDEVIVNNVTI
jgi:hypothetical protein